MYRGMSEPTIASRLKRRCIVMTADDALVEALRRALPTGWEMRQTHDLAVLGGFEDILQYRFMLLDLDEHAAFDPAGAIVKVRMELMLNLAIFCFGGTPVQRDAARLARADRFFDREEMPQRLPEFCNQFGW
jgi:hypothetical protein